MDWLALAIVILAEGQEPVLTSACAASKNTGRQKPPNAAGSAVNAPTATDTNERCEKASWVWESFEWPFGKVALSIESLFAEYCCVLFTTHSPIASRAADIDYSGEQG